MSAAWSGSDLLSSVVDRRRGVVRLVGLLAGSAVAAGVMPPVAAAGAPKPPVASVKSSGDSGDLTAPDVASALAVARLEGKPVEAVGERTEFSSTWAMPDGSMRSAVASGPVWIRKGGNGSKAEDWVAVDLTLEAGRDGSVSAAAHPGALTLSGRGAGTEGAVASLEGPDGAGMALEWAGSLPAPRLEGPRAVYADVSPGVDLVVEATRTGFEQFFVVKQRPEKGERPDLRLRLHTEGATVRQSATGDVEVVGPDGAVIGATPTPLAWDAAVDGERVHPVTKPWKALEGESTDMAPPPPYEKAAEPKNPKDQEAGSGPRTAQTGLEPAAKPVDVPFPAAAQTAAEPEAEKARRAKAGKAVDKEAREAKATPGKKIDAALTVVDPSTVEMVVDAGEEFLQDPEVQYPVVVDPEAWFQWGFDTWVQHGYSSDQSGSTELRLGTYNGGANVARSFVNFDLSGLRGRRILSANISLWEWHSYSCSARNWQVWATDPAGTGTRIGSQPTWWGHWSTSSQTTGYSASCNDGWVAADTTSLIQAWADQQAGYVGMGLKAENEGDSYGWKKFNSANAGGGIPTLYVNYNSIPNPPSAPAVQPAGDAVGGIVQTPTKTPQLSVYLSDPDPSDSFVAVFEVYQSGTDTMVDRGEVHGVPNNSRAVWTPPDAGRYTDGGSYYFRVAYHDYKHWAGVWSPNWYFSPDVTKPGAPIVSSTDYPNDNTWHKDAGQPGTFSFSPAANGGSITRYYWGMDGPPVNRVDGTGTVQVPVTPATVGRHELQVRTVDAAGNQSDAVSKYVFNVGRAGLSSPTEGDRVVRRARLEVGGDPALTHVKFQWRRGPDATVVQDVPLGHLRSAAGKALSDSWTAVSGLGGSASWDAGLTLGHVGGPVQVRPVFATSSAGTGAYEAGWVTITVDPDADGAAATSVGPASVNLLTGEASVTVTDASEFGLAVTRTTSSRDPKAGYLQQKQLLTTNQQKVDSGTTGFDGYAVAVSRATGRGHTGMDSLRVATSVAGSTTDTFAYLGTDGSGNIGMKPGATYRITGWVYVPAGTGLTPDFAARGLRIVGFYRNAAGAHPEFASVKPTVTDAWQQVTVDMTVPADATEAFVRLYNGFAAGSNKEVFFDDLSVRQIWAPFGPQWAAGAEADAAGTDYVSLAFPEEMFAVLRFSDGGEIAFTGAGGGRWFPEPGAESLKLAEVSPGVWRIIEIDGTFTDFTRPSGAGDFLVATTSPPVANATSRFVYAPVGDVLRPSRLIAPVEPGVDGAPANGAVCTTPTPARGCEVLDYTYASTTSAGLSDTAFGDVAGQVSQVSVWATDPATGAVTSTPVARYRYDHFGRLREVWDSRIEEAGAPALKTTYDYDDTGRLITVTPAGEMAWRFGYGKAGATKTGAGDFIDANPGRLLTVTRKALTRAAPGEAGYNTPDGDVQSTIVYGVPLTKGDGGPYDLGPDAIAAWGQAEGATDATAIFGPEDAPGVTTATATAPGSGGYRAASVHYLNASGREVNTATPPARVGDAYLDAIDTAEFDRFGNVTRTLDATNRLLALGLLPDSDAKLAELNLSAATTDARARALSSLSWYSGDGLDVVKTQSPIRRLAIGNDAGAPVPAHAATEYVYDEGKPDGAAYHLVTTQTEYTLVATPGSPGLGAPADPAAYPDDRLVTKTGYDPIDGASPLGGSSGWRHGGLTRLTVDAGAGGTPVASVVRYDAQGRAVESRKPVQTTGAAAQSADAGTVRTVFWTAGANSEDARCGGRPEWAGQPCWTGPAAAVSGHDPARMGGGLPEKLVTAYNRFGNPVTVTESGTGPDGVLSSRTTTTVYDAADRVVSVEITGTNAGAAVPKVATVYDPGTGDATETRFVDGAGAVTSVIRREFDALGRLAKYTDADGAWTASVFDRFGKPVRVSDSLGTWQELVYDRGVEPRGFLTSVKDSVAGEITARFGPDGQLVEQVLPGGIRLRVDVDAAGVPVRRTYERASDGAVVAAASVVENAQGQVVSASTPSASSTYGYDRLGRLVSASQAVTGVGCTTRGYGWDFRANRVHQTTVSAPSGQPCPGGAVPGDTGAVTVTSGYDSADRLVATSQDGAVSPGAGWAYDGLGRITAAPTPAVAGGGLTRNGFYVNDLVATQADAGARVSWGLDPALRLRSFDRQVNTGTPQAPVWAGAASKVNHYADDSDSPAWIAEDVSDPTAVTRMVSGPDGDLAVTTSALGARVLQLVDTRGDVMGTLPVPDGPAAVADASGLAFAAADEFGIPVDPAGGVGPRAPPTGADGRYAWLGAAQRSGEALGGVVLMGVRLYQPDTGRFWSPDPVPGGNATAYEYCSGDPVNCTDLDGRWGLSTAWKTRLAKVAAIAEVASVIPGPIGAAAAAVSLSAYAATGNAKKAAEMALVTAGALVGAGGAVKAGIAVGAAAFARRAVMKARRVERAIIPVSRVQHALSRGHGPYFGVVGNSSKRTQVQMAGAIRRHLGSVGTLAIRGHYRGRPATLNVGLLNRRMVVTSGGEFAGAAFRLSRKQFRHALIRRRVN